MGLYTLKSEGGWSAALTVGTDVPGSGDDTEDGSVDEDMGKLIGWFVQR